MDRGEIEAGAARFARLTVKPLARRITEGALTLISVGPQCCTAAVLKRLNLRHAAFPFDSLFSSLEMVRHCVADDFRTFLDPAEHLSTPLELRPTPTLRRATHRFYERHCGLKDVFNHHEMPESRAHFERSVERFQSAPGPVFLHMVRDEPDRDAVRALRATLRGPLLVVAVHPSGPGYGLSERNGVTVFRSRRDISPLGFYDLADEITFATWLGTTLAGP